METKQMMVADLNVVFGKEEESLISRLDDIVLPALQSGIKREASEKTKFIFEEVQLSEVSKDDFAIQGILIKDTIVDVRAEYSDELGLEKLDKHYKTAPYSLFIIYLKNHRMVLVKNQRESPDIRSFTSTFRDVIKTYVREYNNQNKKDKKSLLPFPIVNSAGIKTALSIKESLKDVEKIRELIFKFYPLNEEWDFDNVFADIDEKIRRTIESKKGCMVFPSPKSKDGVAEIIEATQGVVKTEMKVIYKSDISYSGTKKRGTIKDEEISEIMNVDLNGELLSAYKEINDYKKDIPALNFQTDNHIIDYNQFINKYKK